MSASAVAAGAPPRARSSSSSRNESAWLTRQPKVTTAYFICTEPRYVPGSGIRDPIRLQPELLRGLLDALGHLLLVRVEAGCNCRIADCKNLRRKDAGIGGARLADGDRRDRNARRHLYGREQRVQALQRRRIERYA